MSLDNKIQDYCPRSRRPGINEELRVGIEIEYENLRIGPNVNLWGVTTDGSLRNNGIEYISIPLKVEEIPTALGNLRSALLGSNPIPHTRCGLHVHLNMRPRTVGEVYSFIASYVLLEPTLFGKFCPDRLLSAFCVPLYLNNNTLSAANASLEACRNGSGSLSQILSTSKYGALNLASLARFGTVELRQLPSTLDFIRIQEWIDTLLRLYNNATEYNDPLRITELYDVMGLSAMQDRFLGIDPVLIPDSQQKQAVIAATIVAGNSSSY